MTITLPSPPFHFAEGISNLRDLGGYAISPTSSVRRGFLYRSARLSTVTPAGATYIVENLGIKTVYDLRSALESEKSPSYEFPSTTRRHVPVFMDQDASPEGLALRYVDYASEDGAAGFMRAYREILRGGASGGAYRSMFEHIRDQPDVPLLFHCTAGKDRTGVFAALTLRIAGVKDDDVIGWEYELTERGLAELRAEFVEKLIEKMPAFKENPASVDRMLGAKAEAIKAMLAWVDETYGSVEGYMKKEMGFSDECIRTIRRNLVIEEKAIL
ncbi:hypothetical protein AJ80_08257 [Polytolypa hystricis UAMH7299]|uniref:Tyrosine specific protein phosphatases domain-containing protein n=1 Tax=Polytolypa hystricis (strain UAMH7299) TaxID=1447883 RepID=A0A2B7XAD3_POLH7|nr:hypothetical protein AJ80_08257 [Polytolypa hystricis UAMH7299]